MKYDVFLSICQTEVDGYIPSELEMFENFFDQVVHADQLGFGTAWVAETHLSCEIQKSNSNAVIPHFNGEIGLNTDILQLAHLIFSKTKKINVGSAIRNILCNGGPIAHAEAVKTFLSLHGMNCDETRLLELGFASGRFDFSNRPYGIVPRDSVEKAAWSVVKGKVLTEATEIFLRLLKGEEISSEDISQPQLFPEDFRTDAEWDEALDAYEIFHGERPKEIPLKRRYEFEKLGVIPKEAPMELLNLTIGTHDPDLQKKANEILPVGVFNLSITPPHIIEETHRRMAGAYNSQGGEWQRWMMPRTCMIFIDNTQGLSPEDQSKKAKRSATKAWQNYWKAMEGTIDDQKVEQAVTNTLAGNPAELVQMIKDKYHADDRLMLWFDFNNHDNELIKESMSHFMNHVAPHLDN